MMLSFALKSFVIAGFALGAMHLLRDRSAAERNMVAHFGLLALLVLPIGSMFLPQLVIHVASGAPEAAAAPLAASAPSIAAATTAAPTVAAQPAGPDLTALWPLFYGIPAALWLGLTLLAVLRLLALRTKASVLVEPSWLSALAHAQRRMNFKHGTALLISSDLKSPISWGMFSPVILLNEEALDAKHEAEAIIAHELAHVRGLDWAKLLLARVVTAIFWFNPLVWVLAREAHQLREETADDAVLAADVPCTDYAQLLVGVARHDSKALLIGAHGVAPARGSLSRRVRRVLDANLPRRPVARGFAAGMALGVIGTAAPLAALTFTPAPSHSAERPYYVSAPRPTASLPSVVASSVADATAITGGVVAAQVTSALTGEEAVTPELEQKLEKAIETRLASAHPHPVPAPAPRRSRPERTPDERDMDDAIERAIAAKSLGITPDYAAKIRNAAPGLRIDDEDLVGLKAVGVTPQWLSDMNRAGYRASDVDDLTGARAVGVNVAYVADLAAAGFRRLPLDDLVAMRALGVTGTYIRALKAKGVTGLTPDKLVELRAQGISADALGRGPRIRIRQMPRVVAVPKPEPPDLPEAPEAPEPDDHE